MNLIYIHGINSSHQARKAKKLRDYCAIHHPDIQVHCPDLNRPTHEVMALLREMLQSSEKTAIVGSSLGGFFATCLVHEFACPCILINPSMSPEQSLRKRLAQPLENYQEEDILYTTTGGWQLKLADFRWFAQHRPTALQHASQILLLLKQGDETLDYRVAERYFTEQGVTAQQRVVEQGGDHIMSDFDEKLAEVMAFILTKWAESSPN